MQIDIAIQEESAQDRDSGSAERTLKSPRGLRGTRLPLNREIDRVRGGSRCRWGEERTEGPLGEGRGVGHPEPIII